MVVGNFESPADSYNTRNQVVFYRRFGNWRWKVTAPNGKRVGASTESYHNKQDAISNFEDQSGRRVAEPMVSLGGAKKTNYRRATHATRAAWSVEGLD